MFWSVMARCSRLDLAACPTAKGMVVRGFSCFPCRGKNASSSPHRRNLYCEHTRPVVLVEIDPFVDGVRLVLPRAEGHGRDTVANHPVRVEAAIIRGADGRRCADGGHGRDRAF